MDSKQPRHASRHSRMVLPRRATSAIGQEANGATILSRTAGTVAWVTVAWVAWW